MSEIFQSKLTELVNAILLGGMVPEKLLLGKITFIDKKELSLLNKERPLCVTSVILSLVTKILHTSYMKEKVSMGRFNMAYKRETTNCLFMLLAAIRKAKKKHTLSFKCCDIAKSYDSVNRELMFLKLEWICFKGRETKLIQSTYYDDSVRIRISE